MIIILISSTDPLLNMSLSSAKKNYSLSSFFSLYVWYTFWVLTLNCRNKYSRSEWGCWVLSPSSDQREWMKRISLFGSTWKKKPFSSQYFSVSGSHLSMHLLIPSFSRVFHPRSFFWNYKHTWIQHTRHKVERDTECDVYKDRQQQSLQIHSIPEKGEEGDHSQVRRLFSHSLSYRTQIPFQIHKHTHIFSSTQILRLFISPLLRNSFGFPKTSHSTTPFRCEMQNIEQRKEMKNK